MLEFSKTNVALGEMQAHLASVAGIAYLNYDETTLQVYLDEEPDQAKIDEITALVDSYTAGDMTVRLYDYVADKQKYGYGPTQAPLLFGIELAPLHKDKEHAQIWQGDIQEITYYAAVSSSGVYTTPVVRRTYTITYNAMHIHVDDKFEWYRRDGSLHPDSHTIPIDYFGQRWLSWLERKRGQIIDWLRYHVAAAMIYNLPFDGFDSVADVMIEGGAFFQQYGVEISSYVGGYAQALPEAIQADARAWLELPWPGSALTIREKFQEQLIYT